MEKEYLGKYVGTLVLKPLPDGRRMALAQRFGFEDNDGLLWNVPKGAIVDGASIPQVLWSVLGGPWEGKYRDASVIHDYYCDVKDASWQSVHLVFYRAMLVSGVSILRAKIMYMAVYFAGPRWSETTQHNVQIAKQSTSDQKVHRYRIDNFVSRHHGSNVRYYTAHETLTIGMMSAIRLNGESAVSWMIDMSLDQRDPVGTFSIDMEIAARIIRSTKPSLREIEQAIDAAIELFGVKADVFVKFKRELKISSHFMKVLGND